VGARGVGRACEQRAGAAGRFLAVGGEQHVHDLVLSFSLAPAGERSTEPDRAASRLVDRSDATIETVIVIAMNASEAQIGMWTTELTIILTPT
jgi:hypothetical protein